MQFSTTFIQKPVKEPWLTRFTSQPHQLFFSSAIFFALLVMALSAYSLLASSHLDFVLVHSFGLNFALFSNAFLGFLITVMPKYNNSMSIDSNKYISPWVFYQAGVVIALFVNASFGKVIVSFVIMYFVFIFFKIIKNSQVAVKEDSIYINSILLLGAVFLLIESVTSYNLSMLVFFAYILPMVYVIALRMVPAFYFSYTKNMPWQKPKFIKPLSIIFLFLVAISLQFELKILLQISSFLSASFFGYTIYKLDFFKKTPAILSILVLGFLWFEFGFIILFIESLLNIYTLKLSLHIFALGFVTTLLIGFGSRVAMGHSVPPQPILADKFTIFLFVLTQVLVLSRIVVSFSFINDINLYSIFLSITIGLWIVLFLLWLIRYGKTILRVGN
ncbi:NnrS family protein [Halarcobacter ebronensis]|nr:NnrS family protein [Halarcobacter ebronensis]